MALVTVPGTRREVYAHCCPAQAEADRREWERRKAEGLGLMREREANLPASVTVDLAGWRERFPVDGNTQKAYGLAERFAAACGPGKQPTCGVTIHGPAGTGKTTLVAALIRTVARKGVRVRFENVPELMTQLRSKVRDGGFDDRLRELQRVPVLALDDLGREQVSYFSVETVLYDLIDARYRAGLPLILTSNYTEGELQSIWAGASNERGDVARNAPVIIDRLRERCPWLMLGGKSRRKPSVDF